MLLQPAPMRHLTTINRSNTRIASLSRPLGHIGPTRLSQSAQSAGRQKLSHTLFTPFCFAKGSAAETNIAFTPQEISHMPATAESSPGMAPASATTAAASGHGPAFWRRPYSPGPLTEAEFEQYWDQGYVIKRGLLTQDDIQPCLKAIERCVRHPGVPTALRMLVRQHQHQLLHPAAVHGKHSKMAITLLYPCACHCFNTAVRLKVSWQTLSLMADQEQACSCPSSQNTNKQRPQMIVRLCHVRAACRLVDGVATRLLAAGYITDPVPDADVFTRLALLEQQFAEAR